MDNWDQWRTITIYGGTRSGQTYNGQPITIEHEVWDHETRCPFKGSPLTVEVVNRPPALTIPDVTVDEGVTARLLVSLSKPSNETVTVNYATANGSATAGQDYTATSDTLTFTPRQTSGIITVDTTDDNDQEPAETFTVTLSDPTGGANLAKRIATVTIDDNDTSGGGTPTLSIANAAATEGDPVVFTVTLTGTRTGPVTVDYAVTDGTADAGDDYTPPQGTTLTFSTTDSSQTISVPTIDDSDREPNETFTVTLNNASSGVDIQNVTATGTINDNDGGPPPPPPPTPTLSIEDGAASEGDPVEFTVTLTGTFSGSVTVDFDTADGSADDSDYTARSGTLTFTDNSPQTISVQTTDDTDGEPNETFTVTLSDPTGATIVDGTATGTINDNDGGPPPPPPPTPTLSIEDGTASEGDPVEFTVTLTGTFSGSVTVDFDTADGSADDSDYTARSGTLTFTDNSPQTISVQTTDDTDGEPNETFTVTLSDPTGATIVDGTATGTINDNDGGPPPPPPPRPLSPSRTGRRAKATPSSSPSP